MRYGLLPVALVAALLGACKHEHSAPPAPPGTNPVQHEMRLLHEAMRDAVTAIANGDARPIGASLHKVHAAREATEHALHSKAYKPPKNGDKLGRFEELDRAFHGDLESLLEASQKNDLPATAAALGKALGSCNGCHSEFRF